MDKITAEHSSGKKCPPKGENKRFQDEPWNEKVKRESIRKPSRGWGRHTDYKNENLKPFYRYLLKHVGKSWNDIWSDICRNIKNRHTRDYVSYFVELHVKIIDGIPYDTQGYKIISYWKESQLYVHPETGILCKTDGKSKWSKLNERKPVYDIVCRDHKTYVKHEDIWYLVEFQDIPYHQKYYLRKYQRDFCKLQKKSLYYYEAIKLYGKPIFCVNKRQISSSEIRKQKLN